MTDLLALADEIGALTEPSREMDARIEDAIGPESEYPGSHLLSGFTGGRQAYLRQVAPRYTGSVDAAILLLREVLPGSRIVMDDDVDYGCNVLVCNRVNKGPVKFRCEGASPTLPLAICAAVVRAVAAQSPPLTRTP